MEEVYDEKLEELEEVDKEAILKEFLEDHENISDKDQTSNFTQTDSDRVE